MPEDRRFTDAIDSWRAARAAGRTDGVSPESISAFIGRGLIGCAILVHRQIHSGVSIPSYWRDGMIEVLLDLVDDLQSLP